MISYRLDSIMEVMTRDPIVTYYSHKLLLKPTLTFGIDKGKAFRSWLKKKRGLKFSYP